MWLLSLKVILTLVLGAGLFLLLPSSPLAPKCTVWKRETPQVWRVLGGSPGVLEGPCHPQASPLRRLAGVLSPSAFCFGVLEGNPSWVPGEESPHLCHPPEKYDEQGHQCPLSADSVQSGPGHFCTDRDLNNTV